jgi:hypothetical protein
MSTAAEAYDSARSYLNDVGSQIWTNAKLRPFLVEAHRDLQLALWLNGLPVLKEKSAILQVAALAKELANQPAVLLEPISMKERTAGSQEDWMNMEESDFEADVVPVQVLRCWTWREERIVFVGSTASREVLLRYMKSLTLPVSENSTLGFIFAEVFLGPHTAQYAARAVGNPTLATEALAAAREKLDMVIRANVKGQQNLPARRRPYRRSSRTSLVF